MAQDLTFGGITIKHPSQIERERGAGSTVSIHGFTASGQVRQMPLNQADLIKLLRDGSNILAILHGIR